MRTLGLFKGTIEFINIIKTYYTCIQVKFKRLSPGYGQPQLMSGRQQNTKERVSHTLVNSYYISLNKIFN